MSKMKVLGNRVIIEQTMIRKDSKIILAPNAKDEDKFDMEFKILQLGSDCPTDQIKVGDVPVLDQYVQIRALKVISRTEKKMVSHLIVHYDDILAID